MSHKHREPHKKRHGPDRNAIRKAGDEVKTKPELAVERRLQYEPIGAKRILIELEEEPEKAMSYADQYSRLLKEILGVLERDGIDKLKGENEEKRFLMLTFKAIQSKFDIIYGETEHGLISESIETKKWDCDNSSFLIFDVARELGFTLNIVAVADHAFVRTEHYFFQTTTGGIRPISELAKHYRFIYLDTSDPEKIHSVSYSNRGGMRVRNGEIKKAIEDFNLALGLSPNSATVLNQLGYALDRNGEHALAIENYKRAIEIDPNFASAHNNLGAAYINLDDFDNAVKCFRKAIDIGFPNASYHKNIGSAYFFKGDYQNAIKNYLRALRLGLEDSAIQSNLGLSYFRIKEYQKAVRHLKRAVELNPDPDLCFNLGLAYSNAEFYKLALDAYEEAIGHGYNQPKIHYAKGRALIGLGDYDGAIASFKEAIDRGIDDAKVRYDLAFCILQKGEPEQALDILRAAAQKHPGNEEVLEAIVEVCERLGRADEAREASEALERLRKRNAQ